MSLLYLVLAMNDASPRPTKMSRATRFLSRKDKQDAFMALTADQQLHYIEYNKQLKQNEQDAKTWGEQDTKDGGTAATQSVENNRDPR